MRTRFLAAMFGLGIVLLAAVPVALHATPSIQASRITFPQVTRVCDNYLLGDYVVVHDNQKMARGEPCTTFYRLRDHAAAEAVVSFHCIPRARATQSQTTVTRIPSQQGGTTTWLLVEYQIAGDSEAHGVPTR